MDGPSPFPRGPAQTKGIEINKIKSTGCSSCKKTKAKAGEKRPFLENLDAKIPPRSLRERKKFFAPFFDQSQEKRYNFPSLRKKYEGIIGTSRVYFYPGRIVFLSCPFHSGSSLGAARGFAL